MRVPKAVTMLLVGSLAGAPALYAQGAEFSLGGGLSIPSSTFNDVAKLGWHGLVGLSPLPRLVFNCAAVTTAVPQSPHAF